MSVGTRRATLILIALGVGVLVPGQTGAAHPSDSETLTLDLLLGPEGLETIDGAVVRGSGDPFPSEEDQRSIAAGVLRALGISEDNANINTTASDRYHEVGFTVQLDRPFATASDGTLHIETSQLQQITMEADTRRLKLEVCDAQAPDPLSDDPSASSTEPAAFELRVDATIPGREADYRQNERPGCSVWVLAPDEPPMSLTARVTPAGLARTGSQTRMIGVAAGLLGVGLGLITLGQAPARPKGISPTISG